MNGDASPYDVIIIGGGPAGLTCSIFLGRYCLRVLIIDDGRPRNYAARAIHGFLGQHDIPPRELLARGRAEAEAAGVEIANVRVTKIERVGDVFEVTTANDKLRARRIVLAYGVRDTLPDIPELESYYGTSVHHCPDCDGYEIRGKRVGVVGWGKKAVAVALRLLQWTETVTVFTHGHDREWDEEHQSKLLAERVDVVDHPVVALEGKDGWLEALVLDSGERIAVDSLFFNIKVERSCDLAEQLGCEVSAEKPDVKVDEHRCTTVEGVWAIGDLAPGAQLAITSAADGAIAAVSINKSLLPPSRQV